MVNQYEEKTVFKWQHDKAGPLLGRNQELAERTELEFLLLASVKKDLEKN